MKGYYIMLHHIHSENKDENTKVANPYQTTEICEFVTNPKYSLLNKATIIFNYNNMTVFKDRTGTITPERFMDHIARTYGDKLALFEGIVRKEREADEDKGD